MNEDEFWNLIAEIGWGTKTTDYKAVELWLLDRLNAEQAEEFWNLEHKFQNQLKRSTGESLSCDSWDDVTSHIVGLGKAEFERHLKTPQLIMERLDNNNFVESFSYCIPDIHEYKLTTLDGYTERLKHLYVTYTEAKTNGYDNCDTVLNALSSLQAGDTQTFLASEHKTCEAALIIARVYQRKECAFYIPGGSIGNEAQIWNLYHDVKRYLARIPETN